VRKTAGSDAHAMNSEERQATLSLAAIFALRMLGLFMILPVFAIYADDLKGVTPLLIGVAIGAYGLTQALLQIPFGLLSDRFGRKPIITIGLLLFAIGSVVAALSDSIYGVIIGRALQGSGAVAAAVMALVADLTREERRTQAMATIGITIGLAFSLSLILGPVVAGWVGLSGIFWLTALLALVGIAVLQLLVPQPAECRVHREAEAIPSQLAAALCNPELLRLDFGILLLHTILTALFVAMPLALRDHAGLAGEHHWLLYLSVMLLAFGAMVPFIIQAEKHRRMKQVFLGAIATIAISLFALSRLHDDWLVIASLLFIFFTAFNLLEASLPSLVSKVSPAESRGSSMGVYSTAQFLGAFIGGVAGGWAYSRFGVVGTFSLAGGMALLWLLIAAGMAPPRYLKSHLLKVGEMAPDQAALLAARLREITGVAEAMVIAEDGVAYLKVDSAQMDEAALREFSIPEA